MFDSECECGLGIGADDEKVVLSGEHLEVCINI